MDDDLPYSYSLCKMKTVFVYNKSFRDNQRPINEAHKMVGCFIEIVHTGCSRPNLQSSVVKIPGNRYYHFKEEVTTLHSNGSSEDRGVCRITLTKDWAHGVSDGNQEKGFLRRMADIRGNDPVPSLDCPLFILQWCKEIGYYDCPIKKGYSTSGIFS